MVRLHVLAEGILRSSFCLGEGSQWLGSGPRADLVLPQDLSPPLLCRIDLLQNGGVAARVLEGEPLVSSAGTRDDSLWIPNGDFAEIAGLRLLVLAEPDDRDVELRLPRPTAMPGLALKIRTRRGTQVVWLGNATELRIGRNPDSDLVLRHPEVSRDQARLLRREDGLWLEDLGNAHGMLVNGKRMRAGPLPLGAVVCFSAAPDAPQLVPVSLEDLAGDPADDLPIPLRGKSEGMRKVRESLWRLGPSEGPVLIAGEPGTGKEIVARALAAIREANPPWVIDCASLPLAVTESLLFGYRRSSFSGAA